MAIRAIVEYTIQSGRRDEFVGQLQGMFERHGTTMREYGWLGASLYAVVDEPNKLVEIAEWDSAEAVERGIHSEVMGTIAPVIDLLAEPFRATLIEALR